MVVEPRAARILFRIWKSFIGPARGHVAYHQARCYVRYAHVCVVCIPGIMKVRRADNRGMFHLSPGVLRAARQALAFGGM